MPWFCAYSPWTGKHHMITVSANSFSSDSISTGLLQKYHRAKIQLLGGRLGLAGLAHKALRCLGIVVARSGATRGAASYGNMSAFGS
ncbi:hypothetical protein CA13_11250 [Planctomycetes bacterium CA13]|uniref:Uncharacterized protein n=1 Tax=Novipirellula herctigrandis TaxID=2527986 RepID=A0A5C5YXC9_9BACT|nr:hypothetical protein CA13_11250 [Planctomycetes bacterium CA13]